MKNILVIPRYQIVILILITCAVYVPVIGNNFLYTWDDQIMIINSRTSGDWNFSNLKDIFSSFHAGQYSPLFQMNSLLLYSIDKYNPVIFHLASVLWQIANVLIIWLFIKKILQLRKDDIPFSIPTMAFLTAFLFAIHPLNVEAVAWLSGIKALIYAFFFLLGLIAYIYYITTYKVSYFVGAIGCFLLSFLGKEQAVTFPLVIVLIDWFAGRSFRDKTVITEKIVFFSMASLFGVITILTQGIEGDPNPYKLFHRIAFAGYALFEYVTKSILPVKLNFLYPFPILPDEKLPLHFLIYPVLVSAVGIWIYFNRKNRLLVFWTLFFVINLLFSINLISMARHAIVADRYLYISIMAILFLMLYAAKMFWDKHKRLIVLLFSVYSLYLGTYTFRYTKQWKDSDTIREYAREMLNKENNNQK